MTPDETGANWIGVREASALSGVSVRALQKRAARGSLNARKVESDGVEVWEFDRSDLGASIGANMDTSKPKTDAATDALPARPDAQNVSKVDTSNGANMDASNSNNGRAQTDLTARLLTQLETENMFLRATVEQLQRDGAETRAALREALKLAPKQLTAGAPIESEIVERQTAPKGSEIGSKRRETALTYNDIADEIERRLNEVK